MLVGSALIDFVRDNEALNQMELARGAGYVRTTRTGREQVLVKQFYNSLLAAKGMPISVGKTPGKSAQYETTVHKSGVILLGKTYSEKFGLKPGDALQICIEDELIKLIPLPVVPEKVSAAPLKSAVRV
jgi:bifunctional DNA-binding transcriptional regulator/antitoxin component of YhaV-PrlF toxin-antitoxin module